MKSIATLGTVLVFIPLILLSDGAAADDGYDVAAMLAARHPSAKLAVLKDGMRENVEERWHAHLMEDASQAATYNEGGLYPHPILQSYVNLLGQSLLPEETPPEVFFSFKIIEDPIPYADSLATGSVFISSGMVSLLDNEAQLAFILMHEAGHVLMSHHLEQVIEEERVANRTKHIKKAAAVAGAVFAPGLLGGSAGGGGDTVMRGFAAYAGFKYSPKAVHVLERFRKRRFEREMQKESDRFATEILVQRQFDAREVPLLMAKMEAIVRRSNAAVGLAFAYVDDLPYRAETLRELLGGIYRSRVESVLSGAGFRLTSPQFHQLMSELKRDNGYLALKQDLFTIAHHNLKEAAAIRTDDPVTMYYLGLLYRAIARNPEERSKAASYFKSAIHFDEARHRFPEAYLQYAVELLSQEDLRQYAEIQRALKSYVVLYQRREGGTLPPEMTFIYDYLDLTGDREWVTYQVSNVNAAAPYQLTGDPAIDMP